MAAHRNPALRWLLRAPVHLYHWRIGWLLGRRFLLLIHMGRRSGKRHETVLEVMEYREAAAEAVVMSGFVRNADWLRNIQAAPACEVVIGSRRFAAAYRLLGADEAVCVVAGYERRHRLTRPLIRAVLSYLVGWRYRGRCSDRRRLVSQLPLVSFAPR